MRDDLESVAAPPAVTVVVPTLDRPSSLARCLRSLAAQTLPPERFEVVVSDDGSNPPVSESLDELSPELGGPGRLRVVRHANGGPAVARNRGAAVARGRFLAFTDDDCVPEPDWLERLLARLEATPGALIGGGLRNGLPSDAYAAATQAIMDFVYAERERLGLRLFSTSNLGLPTEGFREIGGFSAEFPAAAGEDYDLCWRWFSSGRESQFAPEAAIVHHHRLSAGRFLRQHFTYGRGLLHMRRRRGSHAGGPADPGPGFYLRLILHPLRRWWSPSAWRCAFLIGVSQLATVCGAAAEVVAPSRRRDGRGAASPARERS